MHLQQPGLGHAEARSPEQDLGLPRDDKHPATASQGGC